MDTIQYCPQSRKNKHLDAYERGQIALLISNGLSPYAIAKKINRAPNTVRAEILRGSVLQIKNGKPISVYFPDVAERKYLENRKHCCPKLKLISCAPFIEYAVSKFQNDHFSFDAICGQAMASNLFSKSLTVSSKTLYNYVDQGLLPIKNIDLPLKVKRSSKRSRVRKNKKILGASIDERAPEVNERTEFGHWEIDTVVGKRQGKNEVLLTLTERMSRKELIRKIPCKESRHVHDAIATLQKELKGHFSDVFKSITSDNGAEFSELSKLEQESTTKIYFAHPYCSGERGSNERHNGLIRRFIPKGKNINDYSIEKIAWVENWCNTLPRKILGYSTPNEVFALHFQRIVSA